MAKKKTTHAAELIFRLSKTSKKAEKFKILDELKNDPIAQEVFFHALNPYWTFGVLPKKVMPISNLKAAKHMDAALQTQWEGTIKPVLDHLITRELTGNAAREAMKFGDAMPIVQRILKKDLRCGVHVSTINEAMNTKWLPTFDLALADEGIVIIDGKIVQSTGFIYPIWAEPKYDGIRSATLYDGCDEDGGIGVKMLSRTGKQFDNFQNIAQAVLSHTPFQGLMLDGEVFGKVFDDVTKVAHTKSGKDDSELSYRVWDCMKIDEFTGGTCERPLWERQKMLAEAVQGCDARIQQAPGCLIQNEAHLLKIFTEMRAAGYEGLILKPLDAMYSYKRSKDWIKVKEMFTDEFKVVGFNVGKGKYSKTLGALVIRVGEVNVEVGSGFTDAQRKSIWSTRKKWLACMVEVKYQEKTKLKADGTGGSLRFPTFLRWRPDVNC